MSNVDEFRSARVQAMLENYFQNNSKEGSNILYAIVNVCNGKTFLGTTTQAATIQAHFRVLTAQRFNSSRLSPGLRALQDEIDPAKNRFRLFHTPFVESYADVVMMNLKFEGVLHVSGTRSTAPKKGSVWLVKAKNTEHHRLVWLSANGPMTASKAITVLLQDLNRQMKRLQEGDSVKPIFSEYFASKSNALKSGVYTAKKLGDFDTREQADAWQAEWHITDAFPEYCFNSTKKDPTKPKRTNRYALNRGHVKIVPKLVARTPRATRSSKDFTTCVSLGE
jgi:hypothetical protein